MDFEQDDKGLILDSEGHRMTLDTRVFDRVEGGVRETFPEIYLCFRRLSEDPEAENPVEEQVVFTLGEDGVHALMREIHSAMEKARDQASDRRRSLAESDAIVAGGVQIDQLELGDRVIIMTGGYQGMVGEVSDCGTLPGSGYKTGPYTEIHLGKVLEGRWHRVGDKRRFYHSETTMVFRKAGKIADLGVGLDALRLHDTVEVLNGDHKGKQGRVTSWNMDIMAPRPHVSIDLRGVPDTVRFYRDSEGGVKFQVLESGG